MPIMQSKESEAHMAPRNLACPIEVLVLLSPSQFQCLWESLIDYTSNSSVLFAPNVELWMSIVQDVD